MLDRHNPVTGGGIDLRALDRLSEQAARAQGVQGISGNSGYSYVSSQGSVFVAEAPAAEAGGGSGTSTGVSMGKITVNGHSTGALGGTVSFTDVVFDFDEDGNDDYYFSSTPTTTVAFNEPGYYRYHWTASMHAGATSNGIHQMLVQTMAPWEVALPLYKGGFNDGWDNSTTIQNFICSGSGIVKVTGETPSPATMLVIISAGAVTVDAYFVIERIITPILVP